MNKTRAQQEDRAGREVPPPCLFPPGCRRAGGLMGWREGAGAGRSVSIFRKGELREKFSCRRFAGFAAVFPACGGVRRSWMRRAQGELFCDSVGPWDCRGISAGRVTAPQSDIPADIRNSDAVKDSAASGGR